MQEENVESFLGIEPRITPSPAFETPHRVVLPDQPDNNFSAADGSAAASYFLKTSSSRYVGKYSAEEIQDGLATGKFKPDWLALRNVDGKSYDESHTESQGPWTALSALLAEKPRAEIRAETPKVVPPPVPAPLGRGWPGTPAVQRWELQADATTVLTSPSEQAPILCVLNANEEVDSNGIESTGGKKWCKITLRNGQKGYVPGNTRIRQLLYVKLEQSRGEMREAPDSASNVTRKLVRGDGFLLVKTIKSESGSWVKIRAADGQEGFLDGKAKITRTGVKAQNTPQHDMLVGGIWCVGGILVTALTYSAVADKGGTYFVAWGAILFGGIQFLRGAFRSMGE